MFICTKKNLFPRIQDIRIRVQTNSRKIEKVKNFPAPKNVTQVRQFLGFASYYRQFVHDFSKIATPLNWLLQKYQKFY